jgi:hypothetical protein
MSSRILPFVERPKWAVRLEWTLPLLLVLGGICLSTSFVVLGVVLSSTKNVPLDFPQWLPRTVSFLCGASILVLTVRMAALVRFAGPRHDAQADLHQLLTRFEQESVTSALVLTGPASANETAESAYVHG